MGQTMVEKILSAHADRPVTPGDIVDVFIDARVARDFGGANVVKNLTDHALGIDDPKRTFSLLTVIPPVPIRSMPRISRSAVYMRGKRRSAFTTSMPG